MARFCKYVQEIMLRNTSSKHIAPGYHYILVIATCSKPWFKSSIIANGF